MSDSGECHPAKHLLLKPLETRRDVEEFWKGIHKEFLAKVEPVKSGLQDLLMERHVLTESDNESLTGSHLPVHRDQARHLFKLLYPIPLEDFHHKVLPALCHKYYYIIPKRFWKDDVIEAMTSEHELPNTRESKHTDTLDNVCLRCGMQQARVRPTTLADFLFQQSAVSFHKYCDLTNNHRTSNMDLPPLFSFFKSLPPKEGSRHITEMTSILHNRHVPIPSDLHLQMARGFPCSCSPEAVDCVGFPSVTKSKRDEWYEYFRRGAPTSDDASSVSLYPQSSVPDSIHSTVSNSSSSTSNISSISNRNNSGQSDGPEARGTHRTGQLDSVREKREDTTPVRAARDSSMLSEDDPKAEHLAPPTPPVSEVSTMGESVEDRMRQKYHLLDQSCPQFPARMTATLNLRKLAPSPQSERDKMMTWPRLRASEPDREDFFPHSGNLENTPSESVASVVLTGLEGRRGSVLALQGAGVDREAENCLEDDGSCKSACSTLTLIPRSSVKPESNASTLIQANAVTRRFGKTEPLCPAHEDRPENVNVAALTAQFERPPASEERRPQQGKVPRKTARFQSPAASDIVPRSDPQQPRQKEEGRGDTDQ